MCMNCMVMCVSICVRDVMGAVLSWFAVRLCALVLDTADGLRRWRVSKTLVCGISLKNCICTKGSLNCAFAHVHVCVCVQCF